MPRGLKVHGVTRVGHALVTKQPPPFTLAKISKQLKCPMADMWTKKILFKHAME